MYVYPHYETIVHCKKIRKDLDHELIIHYFDYIWLMIVVNKK